MNPCGHCTHPLPASEVYPAGQFEHVVVVPSLYVPSGQAPHTELPGKGIWFGGQEDVKELFFVLKIITKKSTAISIRILTSCCILIFAPKFIWEDLSRQEHKVVYEQSP